MTDGDIYINKHKLVSNFGEEEDFKPEEQSFKSNHDVKVDRIILTSNREEKCIIKMMARQTRIPEIGDKFSSRHG